MSISWKTYVGIRKIDVKKYFKVNKIANYNEFISTLNLKDIQKPLESEISSFYINEPKLKKEKTQDPDTKLDSKSYKNTDLKNDSALEEDADKKVESKTKKQPAQQKLDISKRVPRRRTTRKKKNGK